MEIEKLKNKIICGDTLKTLKTFPNDCIDLIITSPPYYGLRDYGVKGQIGLEDTFEEYLKKILKITAELKRVLKKSGQFWLNMGDCYGGIQGRGEGKGNEHGQKVPQRLKYWGGNVKKSTLTNPERQQEMGRAGNSKCLLMQPERLALTMIDKQGWILRNKVKWAKQILIKKKNKTIGSVMPTSVKDRFNESGEEFYFFVKSKKYYSDLDAVRLSPQSELNFERPRMGQGGQTIYEQKRAAGIIRQRDYPESKYNKFNYCVRDAKRKSKQCSQFKASEEEIKNYGRKMSKVLGQSIQGIERQRIVDRYSKGSEYEKKYGEPWDRFGKKTLKARMNDTKNKDQKSSRTYNIKKLLSEVRLGIKPNTGIETNKVKDPRGTHEGGPGSWRDFKDNPENSYPKHLKRENVKVLDGRRRDVGLYDRMGENIVGKNLPTIWQIGSEPHNFSKEYGLDIEHFAIFPEALVEIPIKFGSPKRGIVLDPFMGSGTVAVVSRKLGRNYIGIELSKDYIKIAEQRLRQNILL